ncbi:MAG TPA: hypothetical protein VF958_05875 [Thermoanaerobaculia bacterium]
MRREVALTGGAALAAGLLLGLIADRLAHFFPSAVTGRPDPAPPMADRCDDGRQRPAPVETRLVTDVLEPYRVAAAV